MTTELTKIDFSDNARKVLELRFLSEGETAEERMWDMCEYVDSAEVSYNFNKTGSFLNQTEQRAENIRTWTERFYNELIVPKKFFPNSPTIKNAGSKAKKGGLQGCNVISPEDTMESIYQTVKDWALTEKYGAGIGAYFGDIRAKGSPIGTTHGKALGPIAVMKILSESSKWITQGAFREGAHMAILPIDHPDILEFIHCKDECKLPSDMLANFNISIQMPDWFMESLTQGASIVDNEGSKYLVDVSAIWEEICESAWKTGDPGLFFIDRIRETEPNPQLGLIQSPNPCGEQPLENYNSCNLGSINLGKFVLPIHEEKINNNGIAWNELRETIHLAVRFLDDVIDVNTFPEDVPQLQEMNQKTRRIGLGVMGWHDMLVKLEIPYESAAAIDLAIQVSEFLTKEAWVASHDLAEEKGEFPEWANSRIGRGTSLSKLEIEQGKHFSLKTRNSCVTTVAPTGTLNILAGCSSGIEPYHSLYTERKALWSQGEAQSTIIEVPQAVIEYMQNQMPRIELKDLQDQDLFKTALEISPKWHIEHQAAWQTHISNGISKTINLPNDATVEDISKAYILAWKSKCKGATIYRDGSKDVQVLNLSEQAARKMGHDEGATLDSRINNLFTNNETVIHPIERPQSVEGVTDKILTGHGKVYVTVNKLNGTPIEVFCNGGTAGGCDSANTEAITKLISLCLRSKVDPMEVVEQLRNITCCPIWDNGFHIMSLPDAISKVLHDHIENKLIKTIRYTGNGEKAQFIPGFKLDATPCYNCGGKLIHSQGCVECQSCGWNKCD